MIDPWVPFPRGDYGPYNANQYYVYSAGREL
ncbi:hypothetical protein F4556_006499 [Kitasatospora gansuensis]|uniref:Uncharacterized protein n=1 Tax=Kitasatospora gansuensis TaxID=258050 RepID=A0A7W7SI87_9ACTN|nr:hypothetical protein [Kitasatospora gansuensis]